MPEPKWIAPIDDLTKLDKDSAKFIFESGEKRLRHLLEVSDRTTNRTIAMLTGQIPLVAFILSLLFRHYVGAPENYLNPIMLGVSWASLIVSLISMILLGRIIFPRDMHQMGTEPKDLIIKDFVENPDYQNAHQYLLLLVIESESLQRRIDYMQDQSNRRVYLFKIALLIIAVYGLLCIAALVLLAIFL